MKKILSAVSIVLLPFLSLAQDMNFGNETRVSSEFIRIAAMILVLYLLISFILTIIRSFLEFRLKSKMIDKGVTDKVVEQFLQPGSRDIKTQAIKAFLLLAGIGVGLTAISLTLPVGIHSFAIMAFSLAASFLGYYFFILRSRKSEKF